MKRVLLDTHVLLWFINGDSQLSSNARQIIEDTDNDVYVSIISFFEITIKLSIGKLKLRKPLEKIYQDTINESITILSITEKQIFEYKDLPLWETHKDPFDRLSVATAKREHLGIITIDEKFHLYKGMVDIIW